MPVQAISCWAQGDSSLKTAVLLIAVAALLLLNIGCSPAATSSSQKSIVVTYSILGSIVKELVGDSANVTVLIPNGLDPHEWEPSAKDIEKAYKANLLVCNGLNLENGLSKTIANAAQQGVHTFYASDYISVRHVGQGEGIPSGDPDQAIGAADPHLWMDPLTLKQVITPLAADIKSFLNLDVSQQAANVMSELDALNSDIITKLSVIPLADRKLVTGHESMGYFANRYNFQLVGVIVPSLSSAADVTAADLSNLKQIVQQTQVKAIFTELGTSAATAKTIAQETGVKVVELSTHALPADGTYSSFMEQLAQTIIDALK